MSYCQPILGQTQSFMGAEAFFHNNTNINDWYLSTLVDTVQKLALFFGFLYSTKDNQSKKPEERIYIQNTALMKMFGDVERITIQKSLAKLEDMGIISRKFLDIDDVLIDKCDAHGLTERRIILHPNKLKDLLSTTGKDEIKASGYKPRSKERRFIARRPLSIVCELINSIIKTQVKDVQARKNKISSELLVKQFKQFGNFETKVTDYVVASDEIIRAFDSLVHQPPDIVNRYYIEVVGK